MKKKILIFLYLIPLVIFVVIAYFCLSRGYLYLWKIKSNDKIIYILGTIHAFKEELYQEIDPEIIDAFKRSDILLCEGIDTKSKKWMLPIGDSLRNYITDEYYQKINKLLKEHELCIDGYSCYRPYYFVNRIISIGGEKYEWDDYIRHGIDQFFANKFYYNNIHHNWSKYALEKKDHFAVYLEENLSKEELGYHIYNLARLYLNKGYFIKESCESLMKAWLNGSVDEWYDKHYILKIARLDSDPQTDKGLEIIISAKMEQIHVTRNHYMADTIEEFIKGNEHDTIFAMAGVSHLIGENNIIEILKKKGYKAKRIKRSLVLPF